MEDAVANANWLFSNIPIDVPTTKVIPSAIPKVNSFGCAVIIFKILSFNDIHVSLGNKLIKVVLFADLDIIPVKFF